MSVDLALFVVSLAFALFLLGVEAYCVATGKPTISERIQHVGRSAPLVAVIASFLAGGLLIHFFG